jgi:hypothetical protein
MRVSVRYYLLREAKPGVNVFVVYSASKNQSSVLNILIVLAIPQEPERVRTCN